MKLFFKHVFAALLFTLTMIQISQAAPVIRTASGANAAAIQATVDQFRTDLGGVNNGVGGHFTSGRREINWDGVPDSFSAPNFLPVDFFNVNSPRGVVFSAHTTFGNAAAFMVSADSNNPTTTPVRFGDVNPAYTSIFTTFSAERLFAARFSNVTEVRFFIPGTSIPATVSGFGVVFTDVDSPGPTYVKFYRENGSVFTFQSAPTAGNGLSFVGISYNAGERIEKVEIISGNDVLAGSINDNGTSSDLVAMDDFIYGEPMARDFHSGDADGDGITDARVFRPSVGQWFTLNSGSNTISIDTFGANGDQPIDGDFDGDSRADVAVFRPSEGGWYIRRSTNGTFITQAFGQAGDRPVAGDYDKDGTTDIAVWRPSTGNYFVLRSSDNLASFFAFPFGQNGDIPVQGAVD
ncbi:MAG TPA: VCBS repeat-containing protein [Pyrinomonadaceae bacterium]|nr:VCBS repeat-containing protein [Pyrinomonadaceae bacterium]